MGRIFVSSCRCSIGVVDGHPVIVLRAAFWGIWSLCMLDLANMGCHIGEA